MADDSDERRLRAWNPLTAMPSKNFSLPCDYLSELAIPDPFLVQHHYASMSAPINRITVERCTDIEPATTFADMTGTDLKLPPPNWLARDSSTPLAVQHSCPNSEMAASVSFPPNVVSVDDQDGPVENACDFVASTDDLRRLFSSPHQSNTTPLALTLHRVGKAIVIDGSSSQPKFSRTAKENHDRAMKSKMLYYSVLAGRQSSQERDGSGERATSEENPEAPLDRAMFPRALHWKFRDLQLLLGVDVPIFTDEKHGNTMTMRLKPSAQPLSRVEAVEMWLDNVLCNVSHAALCYHTEGVIQGYQVCSTQDIPQLTEDSTFEPIVIQEFAGHVLQWLKSTCTEEGTSYVLVRDPENGKLKLYNVSKLSGDTSGFNLPLAMMYYRMAELILSQPSRNLTQTKQAAGLLQKCTEMIDPSSEMNVAVRARRHLIDLYKEMAAARSVTTPQTAPDTPPSPLLPHDMAPAKSVSSKIPVLDLPSDELRRRIVVQLQQLRALDPEEVSAESIEAALTQLFHERLSRYNFSACGAALVDLEEMLHVPKNIHAAARDGHTGAQRLCEHMGDLYHHITLASIASDSNKELHSSRHLSA
eukprot:PhM_4_TR18734/c0_g1_i2/m.65866